MIRFFRIIRQRLIFENRLRKYLTYAVGEILLVVLGILIALQINNWNENRKLRNLEYKYLLQVKENLEASSINLAENISYNKRTLNNHEKILAHFRKDLPHSNSLDSAFVYIMYWSEPNLTYSAYETIKSKGFEIIQNDSVRNSIIEIYEESFPFLIGEFKAEWEVYQNLVLPFIVQNVNFISAYVAKPNNFDDLKNNVEFQNLMAVKMRTREFSIQYTERTKHQVDSLITMIERELSKRGLDNQ